VRGKDRERESRQRVAKKSHKKNYFETEMSE
jgi:hypothetical protein